jgi:hypothetical protein
MSDLSQKIRDEQFKQNGCQKFVGKGEEKETNLLFVGRFAFIDIS